MAKDGGQQHKQTKRSSTEEEVTEAKSSEDVAERKERLDDDVDSILDEIDEVLEENAEEFVRGFVQKGGE
ncbi:ubiquitin-like protein Pup [Kribbella orskensis]|jgi:ubiquitin-like protein Pup|uniref:Prokaryotic ubiquitin-like protein Pup n=1 Tax=Kribbella orskensis TaxID=2512216 RepID=A0ABY2BGV0_9ACTN|nr:MULTISPECIES: ubiquitin-like protein Pup [Kribbella]TCM42565.1 ubiquitin-like protein Pup [Kribbella sp. VKM Ac-2568]TCN38059.1 ubiquitin-like protein Pup [Kribbella sp. VKM Ac-2500]TCO19546.1 ubiquitin-like protein Pup [Kribbella orskensis]